MSQKPEKTAIFSILPWCKFHVSCIMISRERNVNKCADWLSTKSALVHGKSYNWHSLSIHQFTRILAKLPQKFLLAHGIIIIIIYLHTYNYIGKKIQER
jgi:hypothetical protein